MHITIFFFQIFLFNKWHGWTQVLSLYSYDNDAGWNERSLSTALASGSIVITNYFCYGHSSAQMGVYFALENTSVCLLGIILEPPTISAIYRVG